MIVLNHLAITMQLGAPWPKTLTCLDLPLATLTGSFEVAAELMGLESLELEVCLSLWHAEMAQLLLQKDSQARIGTVHMWTPKLFLLCVSFFIPQFITCKCGKSWLLSVTMVMVCTNTEVQHTLRNRSCTVTFRTPPFPRPLPSGHPASPPCWANVGWNKHFQDLIPHWPFRFHDPVGIGKSGQGFFETVFQDCSPKFH